MSSEWSTLEEVADVIDSLHKTPTYSECGLPMVRGTDVKYGELNLTQTFNVDKDTFSEFSRRYKPAFNDIIITRVGSYGITARVTKTEFCLGQNTSAIVPTEINPRYLYSALNSSLIWSQIESGVVGSTQKTLSLKVIKALKIPRHGENSETEIASILGALDDRITLLRETNATLEAIAQALFKSWFVDFDPVHAKAQGRQPEGMDEQTAALFPDRFVESELGMVPLGWEVGTLGDELKIAYGKNLPTTKLLESGYPVFGGNGQIGFFDKYLYETRQVLVACRGAASGKVNQSVPKSFVTNNSLILESSENSHIPFGYLKGCMSISDLTPFVTGSAQPQVTIDNLKNFKLLMPQVEIMQSYESFSRIVEDKIQSNSNQTQTLANLRDTLLPRLISGQLRLPDVVDHLGEI
jgi:type I restriction enzyme S subunit